VAHAADGAADVAGNLMAVGRSYLWMADAERSGALHPGSSPQAHGGMGFLVRRETEEEQIFPTSEPGDFSHRLILLKNFALTPRSGFDQRVVSMT